MYPKLGTELLYDQSNDEWEEHNIASDKPEMVEKLTKKLEELQIAMDDKVELGQTAGGK